jgi:integrase
VKPVRCPQSVLRARKREVRSLSFGLEHPFGSVTPPSKSVTVRTGGRAVSIENLRLRDAAPSSVNVTVGKRSREYLTDQEVERLIEAAKQNRSGHRDATAILVAYRHGLRASEEYLTEIEAVKSHS